MRGNTTYKRRREKGSREKEKGRERRGVKRNVIKSIKKIQKDIDAIHINPAFVKNIKITPCATHTL